MIFLLIPHSCHRWYKKISDPKIFKKKPTMEQTHSVSEKNKTEEDVVEELNLSYQKLTVLPPLHPGLKKLFCHGNQLIALSSPLPSGLERLYCCGNQITALPSLPSGLKRLDCSDNQITSLPSLPSGLKELDCACNQLTVLPSLPSELEDLYCSDNKLTALPLLPSALKGLHCRGSQLKYKGMIIEEIRKEQEEEEKKKNIRMANLIVFRKVKQEMGFCEETKFDWLVKNIISHF